MSQRMSKGIRIYEHGSDREKWGRDSYNYYQGMNEIELLKQSKSATIFATGSESGAMTVHFKWNS